MASITLTLSSKTNKDTGKAEVLLRYRNTRSVALRAHSRTFILPEYFKEGKIVIKARIITPKVQEALDAQSQLDLITAHVIDAGNKVPVEDFTQDWLQDTVHRYEYTWTHTYHGRAPLGRSENSVIYYMKAIRAYWHWLLDMGYTTNNPLQEILHLQPAIRNALLPHYRGARYLLQGRPGRR